MRPGWVAGDGRFDQLAAGVERQARVIGVHGASARMVLDNVATVAAEAPACDVAAGREPGRAADVAEARGTRACVPPR